jgi:hypothetical protein
MTPACVRLSSAAVFEAGQAIVVQLVEITEEDNAAREIILDELGHILTVDVSARRRSNLARQLKPSI